MKQPAGPVEEMVAEDKHSTFSVDDGKLEILQQRLQRLEDAIASLQDTRALEDRVFERVRQKGPARPEEPAPRLEERVFDRKKFTLPLLTNLLAPPSAVKESTSPEGHTAGGQVPPVVVIREGLFLLDTWHEFRAMFRMFFDRRYHVAWATRLTTFILVPIILLSQIRMFFIPMSNIPIFGAIWDNFLNLLLGFFLYKVLSREARKYLQAREANEGIR